MHLLLLWLSLESSRKMTEIMTLFFKSYLDMDSFRTYERTNTLIKIMFVSFRDNTVIIAVSDSELAKRIRSAPASYCASSVWQDEVLPISESSSLD